MESPSDRSSAVSLRVESGLRTQHRISFAVGSLVGTGAFILTSSNKEIPKGAPSFGANLVWFSLLFPV